MGESATAVGQIRRKTMLERPTEREDPEAMRAPDGAVRDWFKLRTCYQQFMRENEALFRALAASSDDPLSLLAGGGLADAAAAAAGIATAAARRASGRAAPAPHETRPFRQAAALMAASAWQAGRLDSLDPDRIGAELAGAAGMVREDLDRSPFKDGGVSDDASLAMTVLTVTLRLMEPVMTYDFRRDRSELVAAMSGAVISMAAEVADAVVPPGGKPEDRRSVVQTLANCLSSVMAQVYERKAKQHLSLAVSLPEDEREAFARRYDPMHEVLRSFRENANVYAGAAYASARAAADAVGSPRGGGAAPR